MKNGLGRKLGKKEFHSIWAQHFAPYYEQITLSEVNSESHCTLCGHPIYNFVGKIEKTLPGDITFEDVIFQVPNTMEVGCECYELRGSGLFKIIKTINEKFPGIKVKVRNGKILLDSLLADIYEQMKNKPLDKHYKMFIPIKYLTCNHFDMIYQLLQKSEYPYLIYSEKDKKGWADVFYEYWEKPISNVKPKRINNKEGLELYFLITTGSILIIDLNILK